MALLLSIKRDVNVSPGAGTPAVYHASQGDIGTRIILGLINDNADYTIPDGTTAIIRGTRGDGTIFEEITAEVATTEIKFNLTEDMTSVPGPVECEAVMSSGSANVLGTANFIIDVEQSSIGDAPAETTDATWSWILNKLSTEQVAALGDDVIGAITTNAEDIDTLEHSVASAVNGTPVAVSLAALMTDTTKIYLYTGSEDGYTAGNWYYYDGSAWVSGGVYGTDTTDATLTISGAPADAKKTGDEISALNYKTNALANGSPTAVETVAEMTDTANLYVYTGSESGYTAGHWYWYDGAAWQDGGQYGAGTVDTSLTVPGAAADSKTVGDAISEINGNISSVQEELDTFSNVPTSVRTAIYELLDKAVYTETGLADELSVVRAWAETITAINLDQTSLNINGDNPVQLTAVTTPNGGTVAWTQSDASVAIVTNGLVTPMGNGTAVITATCGVFSASCTVVVTNVATKYSVTNSLTGCTTNNQDSLVSEGSTYSATITAEEGYSINDSFITVTMGGVDVTANVLSNCVISIAEVTGDIVITAAASNALYPLVNGTFTFSNGTTVTVTRGNHVAINLLAANGKIGLSDISENTTDSTSENNYYNLPTKFTIPSGATAVLQISNYVSTQTSSVFAAGRSDQTLGMSVQVTASSTTRNTTKTFTDATDLGCIAFSTRYKASYEFDVSFTVNGTRYI